MDSRDLLLKKKLSQYNPYIKAHSRIFIVCDRYVPHQSLRFN
ncbi:hypothetical protein CWATWH8502_4520 [Crocosphaera watsonii WH 8502]|uniref:Uncharacterized protein n=1 Tax=Crocosphaera watsonii WH 8502 TaxID=423474 RepID=T2I7W0_CROWT|nr:hypothetical protein CWATWH8502_4520 [Crocosphaera watsonii WH 8502]